MYKCAFCGQKLDDDEAYEYRGAFSCEGHFDAVIAQRDCERESIIKAESAKTKPLQGFDLSDSAIGLANRQLLGAKIALAKQESPALKRYEGRD